MRPSGAGLYWAVKPIGQRRLTCALEPKLWRRSLWCGWHLQRLASVLFIRPVFGLVTSARAAMDMAGRASSLWHGIRRFEKIRRALTREKSRRAKTAALPELPCGYYVVKWTTNTARLLAEKLPLH